METNYNKLILMKKEKEKEGKEDYQYYIENIELLQGYLYTNARLCIINQMQRNTRESKKERNLFPHTVNCMNIGTPSVLCHWLQKKALGTKANIRSRKEKKKKKKLNY